MRKNNKVLVVLNPSAIEQVALDRALFINKNIDIEITALTSKHNTPNKVLNAMKTRLKELLNQGIKIHLEVSDEKDLVKAIIYSHCSKGYDLIIKEPHLVNISDTVFTPLDWKILRLNIASILMTKGNSATYQKPIVAAINARPADTAHQQLNERILETADLVAKISNSSLHLVSAYPSQSQAGVAKEQVSFLQEKDYKSRCHKLAKKYDILEENIHLGAGPTEYLLSTITDNLNARMLIIGTVARSGQQGDRLGNTAEKVLKQISCDVLVLPPDAIYPIITIKIT